MCNLLNCRVLFLIIFIYKIIKVSYKLNKKNINCVWCYFRYLHMSKTASYTHTHSKMKTNEKKSERAHTYMHTNTREHALTQRRKMLAQTRCNTMWFDLVAGQCITEIVTIYWWWCYTGLFD